MARRMLRENKLPRSCPKRKWAAYWHNGGWLRKRNRAMERACRRGWAEWTEQERARNRARKRARYLMQKAGLVRRGDGKEVHHINGCPLDNRLSNLVALSRRQHRAVTLRSKDKHKQGKGNTSRRCRRCR